MNKNRKKNSPQHWCSTLFEAEILVKLLCLFLNFKKMRYKKRGRKCISIVVKQSNYKMPKGGKRMTLIWKSWILASFGLFILFHSEGHRVNHMSVAACWMPFFSNLNEDLQNHYLELVFVSSWLLLSCHCFLAFSLFHFFPHFTELVNIKSMTSKLNRMYFQQVVLRSSHFKMASCCPNTKSKASRRSIALNFCPLMFI